MPLLLIDDLPAELDAENRGKVCELLATLGAQTFLTSIEPEMLFPIVAKQAESRHLEVKQFHVKHGKIDTV
jgi:recombinational DNA repair ATPase RecF